METKIWENTSNAHRIKLEEDGQDFDSLNGCWSLTRNVTASAEKKSILMNAI